MIKTEKNIRMRDGEGPGMNKQPCRKTELIAAGLVRQYRCYTRRIFALIRAS